ncbi:hypothetical protein Dimus_002654 [Dionaea muscipula]
MAKQSAESSFLGVQQEGLLCQDDLYNWELINHETVSCDDDNLDGILAEVLSLDSFSSSSSSDDETLQIDRSGLDLHDDVLQSTPDGINHDEFDVCDGGNFSWSSDLGKNSRDEQISHHPSSIDSVNYPVPRYEIYENEFHGSSSDPFRSFETHGEELLHLEHLGDHGVAVVESSFKEHRGLYNDDEVEIDGGYDLDDELVPWEFANRLVRQRMRKLGKRSFARMTKSKKLAHIYTQPGCLHGKHGLGLKSMRVAITLTNQARACVLLHLSFPHG